MLNQTFPTLGPQTPFLPWEPPQSPALLCHHSHLRGPFYHILIPPHLVSCGIQSLPFPPHSPRHFPFYFQSHRSFLTSDKHPQINHTLKVNRIPFQTLDPFPSSPSQPSFWAGSLLLESAFSLLPPHWTQSAGPHVTAHCSLVANQGPHPLCLSVSHRTYMHRIHVQ